LPENDMKPLAGSEENAAGVDPANLAQPSDRLGSRSAHPSKAATAAFDCQYLLTQYQREVGERARNAFAVVTAYVTTGEKLQMAWRAESRQPSPAATSAHNLLKSNRSLPANEGCVTAICGNR
jgi:hypothetical protein